MRQPRRPEGLDALFRPRSIAVVGASRERATIGRQVIQNLLQGEFTGTIFPVNPKAAVVNSMKCYPSLAAIDDEVDLAVLTVRKELVPGVVGEAAKKGVRGLVVITAGFKEVGGEGAALEDRLVETVRRHGMRMVGPNCMGIINTEPAHRMNATFAAAAPLEGGIGFISQSGALGEVILSDARAANLGVAMFVSMGNKADVSANDLLEYWEDDPAVRLVLMYLESFGNPAKFTSIARRIARKKPVITVKAGRTTAGARAASSHTGALVERDVVTETLLEQCGVLRASSIREMFTFATAFATQPPPRGKRVAIVTNAGGPGILATDACVNLGLEMATLSGATTAALRKALRPEASPVNPVDLIASAAPEHYRKAIRAISKDRSFDALIVIFVSPIVIDAFEVAREIAAAVKGEKRPVLTCFMGRERSEEGVEELRRNGLPVYSFPEEAASALAAMVRYAEFLRRPAGKRKALRGVDAARARRVVAAAAGPFLTGSEVEEILRAYSLPLPPSRVVASAAEAMGAAIDIGYPVVVKALSAAFTHKTEVGGVRLDLRTADEVAAAVKDLAARLGENDRSLRFQIQKMIKGGKETILGASRDPQFGPVLLFGLGGIYAETLRDTTLRIHPLTDQDAHEMVREIRGRAFLEGVRGEAASSFAVLEDAIQRLDRLVGDVPEIAEIDVNPFIAGKDAASSFAVDCRIRIEKPKNSAARARRQRR